MRLNWTKEQSELLKKMEISFDVAGELSDEQIFEIDDATSSYLVLHCIENDNVVGEGFLCESILDVIGEL